MRRGLGDELDKWFYRVEHFVLWAVALTFKPCAHFSCLIEEGRVRVFDRFDHALALQGRDVGKKE